MKMCHDCSVEQPLTNFPRNKGRPDGRGRYCKSCYSVRAAASYARRRATEGRQVRRRVEVPPGTARCPACAEIKPLSEFPRNRSAHNGRSAYCKPCHNAKGRETYTRLYGSTREYHLRRRYGIGQADYDALLEKQGGLCALCRQRPAEHVDHDHVTGRIRGLLCSCCNQALGNARDDIATLQRAIDYLRRTTHQRVPVAPGVLRIEPPQLEKSSTYVAVGLAELIAPRR